MVTYIVIANRTDFLIIAEILAAVPIVYSGLNVYQKTKMEQPTVPTIDNSQ